MTDPVTEFIASVEAAAEPPKPDWRSADLMLVHSESVPMTVGEARKTVTAIYSTAIRQALGHMAVVADADGRAVFITFIEALARAVAEVHDDNWWQADKIAKTAPAGVEVGPLWKAALLGDWIDSARYAAREGGYGARKAVPALPPF